MRPSLPPLLLAALLLGAGGCKPPAPVPPPAPERAAIEVLAPGGALSLLLDKSDQGYTLKDVTGRRIGDVVLAPDALRVLDPEGGLLSLVERRGDGFLLKDADGATVLEAEATAQGHALSRKGALFASRDADGLVVGAHRIFTLASGAYAQVLKDGDTVLEIRGRVDNSAAAFLALAELPFPERVALMVWMNERA